jgi:TetR/AcrR family transcriptional regulator
MQDPDPSALHPHRTHPSAEARKYDADRSVRRLLDAALDEFAAHGFAGTRVADIADRAGLSKQLISYYFGGKEGLYQGVIAEWQARERMREDSISESVQPLADLVTAYLAETLADSRRTRLLLWRALSGSVPELPPADDPGVGAAARMRRRHEGGEIAADLDPDVVLIVLMAAIAAPVTLGNRISRIMGLDPASPEFAELYTSQLRQIVRHLSRQPEHEPPAAEQGTAGA